MTWGTSTDTLCKRGGGRHIPTALLSGNRVKKTCWRLLLPKKHWGGRVGETICWGHQEGMNTQLGVIYFYILFHIIIFYYTLRPQFLEPLASRLFQITLRGFLCVCFTPQKPLHSNHISVERLKTQAICLVAQRASSVAQWKYSSEPPKIKLFLRAKYSHK